MSTHPNAMLLGVLVPDELARKTHRAILAEAGIDSNGQLKIGSRDYSITVMESDFDDHWQITAPEGSVVLHTYLTYGYGETVAWSEVEALKNELEAWLQVACETHKCSQSIHITANYW